ncbi:hypothetical protein AADZ90_020850 [Aestuariibius sp. 2305UL40-4]|uniref:hypothetical protein n=1 Tax=Aestuariibius violaceus TaxID=3234132 RepID=UPI00345EAF4A
MLTLSNETLAGLDALQIDRDVRSIADWLYSRFEPWFLQIGAGSHDVARSVRRIQQWSDVRALRRDKDIRMLALMSLTQGTFFHADPRFARTLDRAVRRFELDPDARLDGIYAAFEGWRREVVGPGGWRTVADRTAALLIDTAVIETANPDEITTHVLPAQAKWTGSAAQDLFLKLVVDEGRHRSLPTRRHHACHMAISTLIGYRWMTDPKLTCLAGLLSNESDPEAMAQGLAGRLTEHSI